MVPRYLKRFTIGRIASSNLDKLSLGILPVLLKTIALLLLMLVSEFQRAATIESMARDFGKPSADFDTRVRSSAYQNAIQGATK